MCPASSGMPAAGGSEADAPRRSLRPVTEVLDGLPPLAPTGVALIDFAAATTSAAWASWRWPFCRPNCARSTLRLAPPPGAAAKAGAVVSPADCRRGGLAHSPGAQRPEQAAALAALASGPRPSPARAAARCHRQRQDRGLPACGRTGAGRRPAGAGAGARDQPHAAAGGAFCGAFRGPARQPAQRPDAGAAPAPLAAGAPGPWPTWCWARAWRCSRRCRGWA
jgi:hypothetical protein